MTPEALPLGGREVALVFGPAVFGYALLSVCAVTAAWSDAAPLFGPQRALAALRSRRKLLSALTLTVITLHVGLLWWLRFGFDPAVAVRNGWIGFSSFHLAFITIWVALPGDWIRPGLRRWLILGAWLLVTSGALGAPFRYPIVADLAAPVIVIAAAGALGIGHALIRRRAPTPAVTPTPAPQPAPRSRPRS